MSTAPPEDTPTETTRHAKLLERANARDEPARVKTLRQRYARALRGALADIRAALRTGIVDNNALALETGGAAGAEALADAPGRRQFEFSTDREKVAAARRWLEGQLEADVLSEYGGENKYIEQAYLKGIEDAQTELSALQIGGEGEAAAAMRLPVHQSRLEAMYSRNLAELEGITTDISRDVRRELTNGIARGRGPTEIARSMADIIGQVDDGTPRAAMNRATRLARTEVMHNHNHAMATEFERSGVTQVGIITASTACETCEALAADGPYPVEEAKALIPARTHPNCRCSLKVHTDS